MKPDREERPAIRRFTFPLLILLLLISIVAAIWAGAVNVSPLTLVRAALFKAGATSITPPSRQDLTIVLHIRLPRITTAFLVGSALSMCGVAMQGLFRNPMASPDILGITAGSLGAVIAISTGLYSLSAFLLPVFAMVGAVTASVLIYFISSSRGRTSLLFVVLAGLAISSLFNGLVSAILLFSKQYEVSQFIFWTMGSFDGRMWKHIAVPLPILLPGMALVFFFARDLNMFSLGEENAHSVGMSVEWVKRLVLAIGALVTGTAIAIGGPVGFVGLLIPHLFRFLVGPDHRVLLPAAAIGGGTFLIIADLIGRVIVPPFEIRVGIITAVVGSPYFLYLIIRYQRKGFQAA